MYWNPSVHASACVALATQGKEGHSGLEIESCSCRDYLSAFAPSYHSPFSHVHAYGARERCLRTRFLLSEVSSILLALGKKETWSNLEGRLKSVLSFVLVCIYS